MFQDADFACGVEDCSGRGGALGGGEFGVFGGYFFFDVGECKGVGDGGVLEIVAGDFVVFIDEVGVGDFWWFVFIV